MNGPKVLKADKREVIPQEWGKLIWFASAKLGNSQDMTLGQCILKPGQSNPLHSHPNCSEILHVAHGRIMHTSEGGKDVELNEGDSIACPPNFPHRAKNIADADAVLFVAFSSAHRQVKGE
jgi:quercetin dioxygenase-like cupin family protein